MSDQLVELRIAIKVIYVGNKPMSVAVFKQLPMFDHTLFDGEVFGFVKYVVGKIGLWFLCEKNGVLFKSPTRSWGSALLEVEWKKFNSYRNSMGGKEVIERSSELSMAQRIFDYEQDILVKKPQVFIAA